jgi:hypothetical protein
MFFPLLDFEDDHAVGGMVLVFRIPEYCIGQSPVPPLARPGGDHRTSEGLALEEIQRVDLERCVEQQLDAIRSVRVLWAGATGRSARRRFACLQMALPLWQLGQARSPMQ